MADKRGWLAEQDADQPDKIYTWRAVLQCNGFIVTCDGPWFATEEQCLKFIREEVAGKGMFPNGGQAVDEAPARREIPQFTPELRARVIAWRQATDQAKTRSQDVLELISDRAGWTDAGSTEGGIMMAAPAADRACGICQHLSPHTVLVGESLTMRRGCRECPGGKCQYGARSRSCPACHSIGPPGAGCRNPWHIEVR